MIIPYVFHSEGYELNHPLESNSKIMFSHRSSHTKISACFFFSLAMRSQSSISLRAALGACLQFSLKLWISEKLQPLFVAREPRIS